MAKTVSPGVAKTAKATPDTAVRRSDTGAVVVRGRHYTLGEISRGAGIARPHVTRIFNRKRGLTLAMAQRISGFLGVPIEDVIGLVK